MSLKNVYLVQAGEKFEVNKPIAYLPYAVGAIAAQAWSNKIVRDAFDLKSIFFLRKPAELIVAKLEEPFLVGFSCYLWNYEYNKAVAKKIKECFPECLILFGGHNVPSDTSLLDECEYIDILIHGEGEEVFEKLLCSLSVGKNIFDVPNISYRGDCCTPLQTSRKVVRGCNYASPYVTGIFDRIISDNPDIHFHAILETNRGCPNGCTYCDFGPHKAQPRLFPLMRIKGDIDWFSKNKIEYLWGADANFGLFERDSQIVDWLVEAKNKTGYPDRIKVSYAKNSGMRVFELSRKLAQSNLSKGTTISFQTLSEEALKNIKRINMTLENFSNLLRLYNNEGIQVYTEMILALPGETYESFVEGFDKLLEAGQHSMIEVYDCELLANSVLAKKSYIKEHKIKTVHVPFFLFHSDVSPSDVVEYSDIVVSTESMPPEDWVRCKLFSSVVQALHCFGLLRCFAIYLHNEKQIKYSDFYSGFIEWSYSHPSPIINMAISKILEYLEKIPNGINVQYYHNELYGDVRWSLDEGAFLFFITNINRFFSEAGDYLLTFGIDKKIFKQLLNYQENIICKPDNKNSPISLDYDFYHYFLNSINNEYTPLEKIKNKVTLPPCQGFTDPVEYAREIVLYGRRLVRTVRTNDSSLVKVDYCNDNNNQS